MNRYIDIENVDKFDRIHGNDCDCQINEIPKHNFYNIRNLIGFNRHNPLLLLFFQSQLLVIHLN